MNSAKPTPATGRLDQRGGLGPSRRFAEAPVPSCEGAGRGARGGGGGSMQRKGWGELLTQRRMFVFFPLLVLKGTYHNWTYLLILSRGLNQMEVTRAQFPHFLPLSQVSSRCEEIRHYAFGRETLQLIHSVLIQVLSIASFQEQWWTGHLQVNWDTSIWVCHFLRVPLFPCV